MASTIMRCSDCQLKQEKAESLRTLIRGLSIRSRREHIKLEALLIELEEFSCELQRITSKISEITLAITLWTGTNPSTENSHEPV